MATDTPEDGSADSGSSGKPRRAPPTIDLDPAEVSGDSLRSGAGRARWKSMMDDLRARVRMPQVKSGIVPGLLSFAGGTLAILALAAAIGTFGLPHLTQPATDPQRAALDEINARLARLEQRPAPPAPQPPQSNARVEAVEAALKGIRDNLAALQKNEAATLSAVTELKAAPRASAPPDLAPLTERLSRLEQVARSESSAPSADAKLRASVIALALDTMVRRGDPFVELLGSAKQAGISAAVLAPLDGFAATGVPDDATLARQLLQLLPQLAPPATAAVKDAKPAAMPADHGWLERLKSGAASLVSIERVDDAAKPAATRDERGLILARIKTAAERSDVATAQRELQRLSDNAAAKPWLEALARRDAARETSRKLVATTISAFNDAAAR